MKKSKKETPKVSAFTPLVIVSNGDDWEGVYDYGKLVYEDHKITVQDLVKLGYVDAVLVTTTSDLEEEHGARFPDDIKDLKLPT